MCTWLFESRGICRGEGGGQEDPGDAAFRCSGTHLCVLRVEGSNVRPESVLVLEFFSVGVFGQIIGGAVLHDGCIAEMKTGEGKTLVSTLAAYLNALTGEGVHGTL
jgi:hypothetical protein